MQTRQLVCQGFLFIILFTVLETIRLGKKPSFSMFVESHKESKTARCLFLYKLQLSAVKKWFLKEDQ